MAEDDGHRFGIGRMVLEAVSGIVLAFPVGVFLYFMPVLVWAMFLENLAYPILLMPYVGSWFATWAVFTPAVILLLAAGAVAMEVWVCRVIIRRNYPIFAYTQAVLGLAVSAPFFYWTVVHQKPMLPFWGQ